MQAGERQERDDDPDLHLAREDRLTFARARRFRPKLRSHRYARSIAAAIVQARREDYIVTTQHLARVVAGAVPSSYEKGRIHPATRVFLALRMIVNEELEHLKQAIEGAAQILRPGGSLAILTFQSIEDRLVKQLFKQSPWEPWQRNKPLDPSPQELRENPRARSAKLRAARLALR